MVVDNWWEWEMVVLEAELVVLEAELVVVGSGSGGGSSGGDGVEA